MSDVRFFLFAGGHTFWGGDPMNRNKQTIELQRAFNRRLYRMGILPEEVFSMAEIVLVSRLTQGEGESTINTGHQ